MTTEALTLMQRQRQRKFHRRSRNGCGTCKTKHIRCDERKPLCTHCLRHGGECGYPPDNSDAVSTTTDTERRSVSTSVEPQEQSGAATEQSVMSLLDSTPNDPFLGTSFDMPHNSRSLFQLFTNSRVLYTTRVERTSDSFIVHKALSHPGFLHAAMLMTTLHWAWCTGDVEQFRVPYLYHKLQAIRFVNEQLKHPETAVNDGTIAAVASLALVENSLGSTEAVSSHLRGLARIKELQGEERRPKKMGLLQRMILMAARSVSSRPVWDILDISRTDDVHQSMIISLLRVALRPIYSVFTLSGEDGDSAGPLSEVMAQKTPPPAHTPSSSQAVDSNGVLAPLRSVDCSRVGFIACYFYLYVILREATVDPFILNWFIEQLLADVCHTEPLMYRGEYSQSLWLWTVMFGACVTTAARAGSAMEAEQMRLVHDIYLDKINLVSQVLRIETWEDAKGAMRLFAWEDDFDGELELKALWEEAVWQDDGKRPKTQCFDSVHARGGQDIIGGVGMAQACW
ncbi:Uu.00g002270.m01.CDS01 [Anthostomella pinea]|uniref:Uu.00g002270.m01.CDS01 n=1 Tax=Anthostomella pinea TaxID=933095 RepID=A0AAI8VK53_9PEZI|nr:Uu.00g002270.m01.CDS01 [Anthostomella pinea]